MNLKQPSFKIKDSVFKYFLDIQGQNINYVDVANCF